MIVDLFPSVGSAVGLGHLTRSIAYGEALEKIASEIRVIHSGSSPVAWRRHYSEMWSFHRLGRNIKASLACLASERAARTKEAKLAIVDGPESTLDLEIALSQHYDCIVAIDDYLKFSHRSDVIIDPNDPQLSAWLGPSSSIGNLRARQTKKDGSRTPAKILQGWEFAFLRGDFGVRDATRPCHVSEPRDLCISMGGTNNTALMYRILHEVSKHQGSFDRIHILVPYLYPGDTLQIDKGHKQIASVVIHKGKWDVVDILSQSFLVFTRGGQGSLEAIKLGIPVVVVSAKNDEEVFADLLKQRGCCRPISEHSNTFESEISLALSEAKELSVSRNDPDEVEAQCTLKHLIGSGQQVFVRTVLEQL